MSDCFWTDLVRAAQNCGGDPPAPEGPIFVAAGAEVYIHLDIIWFIQGVESEMMTLPAAPYWWPPSHDYNGAHVSARYPISGAYFDTLETGGVVSLSGLVREGLNLQFDTPDGGISIEGDVWPEATGWQALSHPPGSCWIIELSPGSASPPLPEELEFPEYDDEGNPVYPENFWWPAAVYVAYRIVTEP